MSERQYARVHFSKRYSTGAYQTEEASLEAYVDVTGMTTSQQVVALATTEAELEMAVFAKLVTQGYMTNEQYNTEQQRLQAYLNFIRSSNK